ncbi:MAG: CvpA family protein [bacterium]|nr:CvpA family protein [bacterium]
MNIIDVVIIFGLILGGMAGARNGVFKQTTLLIGTILCFVLSWLLKDFIANFLSYTLPFFNFAGPFEGLTSLNIVMYQLIAFLILMALFTSVLVVLLKITGGFEKFLKFTVLLGIPSKILGFIVGVLEAYVILFAILFFVNQPALNFDVVNESHFKDPILTSSPGLSNMVGDMNDAINDIYYITKDYHYSQNSNTFNKRVVNSLLEHNVIDDEYLSELRTRGKINY